MKFCNTLIKSILLIGLWGFSFSCSEEPFPELPAETHTGAGTFGCLVNNELVFALSRYNQAGLVAGASYDRNNNRLRISSRCQFGQEFEFLINNPNNKQTIRIDTVRYLPPDSTDRTVATQIGNITLTRFDSLTYIVSGTFSFDLNEAGKSSVHVTKGRFDLTFNSY